QTMSTNICDQQQFVTGVEIGRCGLRTVLHPKLEAFSTGFRYCVRPVVSEDRRSVHLVFQAEMAELDTPTLHPVTLLLRQAGSEECAPKPFTQFLQEPKLTKHAVKKACSVPHGKTVVLAGWKTQCEGCPACCANLLSMLPYVGPLYAVMHPGHE